MKSKYKIEENLGKSFGKWTVLSMSHMEKFKQYWICKCECGIEKPVRADHLINSKNKSCRNCILSNKKGLLNPNWKGGSIMSSSMLSKYISSAKKRNLSFNITIEDIETLFNKQKGKCKFTNIDLTFPEFSKDHKYNCSIDRIDSAKGYTIDNIQLVDKSINMMKMSLSDKEFIRLCNLVSKTHYDQKNSNSDSRLRKEMSLLWRILHKLAGNNWI